MTKTIMLVDDSATIRKIVELTFGDTEIRVESVSKDLEVLARVDSLEPDLVLADVTVPEPSGYEICRSIKTSARPVPVILLCGTFEPLDQELARRCGADGQLVKPFESHALHERVSQLLDGPFEGIPSDKAPFDEAQGKPGEVAADEASFDGRPVDDVSAEGEGEGSLSQELVDAVTRAVIQRLSADVVREIAREVVPDLAARIIRERIRELESEDV